MAPPERTVVVALPPAAPPFLLPFDKPEVRLGMGALTWRGSDGRQQPAARRSQARTRCVPPGRLRDGGSRAHGAREPLPRHDRDPLLSRRVAVVPQRSSRCDRRTRRGGSRGRSHVCRRRLVVSCRCGAAVRQRGRRARPARRHLPRAGRERGACLRGARPARQGAGDSAITFSDATLASSAVGTLSCPAGRGALRHRCGAHRRSNRPFRRTRRWTSCSPPRTAPRRHQRQSSRSRSSSAHSSGRPSSVARAAASPGALRHGACAVLPDAVRGRARARPQSRRDLRARLAAPPTSAASTTFSAPSRSCRACVRRLATHAERAVTAYESSDDPARPRAGDAAARARDAAGHRRPSAAVWDARSPMHARPATSRSRPASSTASATISSRANHFDEALDTLLRAESLLLGTPDSRRARDDLQQHRPRVSRTWPLRRGADVPAEGPGAAREGRLGVRADAEPQRRGDRVRAARRLEERRDLLRAGAGDRREIQLTAHPGSDQSQSLESAHCTAASTRARPASSSRCSPTAWTPIPSRRQKMLSLAYSKMDRPHDALDAATKAVDLCKGDEASCIDALGRRAAAHAALGDAQSALADLNAALDCHRRSRATGSCRATSSSRTSITRSSTSTARRSRCRCSRSRSARRSRPPSSRDRARFSICSPAATCR